MSDREPVFWDCSDGSELSHTDEDDAIEAYLDAMLDSKMTPAEVLATLPEMVTVYGFAHDELVGCEAWAEIALESLIECIDDEYGNPDKMTQATKGMLDAARAFVTAVVADYAPWRCSKVAEKTIEVEPWIREHRPDWLEVSHG
jgi:hypothetical protein